MSAEPAVQITSYDHFTGGAPAGLRPRWERSTNQYSSKWKRRRAELYPVNIGEAVALLDVAREATPGPFGIGQRTNAKGACHPVRSTAIKPDGVNEYGTVIYFSARSDALFHALARKYLPLLCRDVLRTQGVLRRYRKPSMGTR